METDVVCSDVDGTSFTFGELGGIERGEPTTSTATCGARGRIGSIVSVPSDGRRDTVALKIVMGLGRPAEDCVPPYGPGCIVSRRALRYIPHTPLKVTVTLQASCEGIACGETETCWNGDCVDATHADPDRCAAGPGCSGADLPTPAGFVPGCGDVGGLQQGAAWPMRQSCPTRIGRSSIVARPDDGLRWQYGKAPQTPAVAASGVVYAASDTSPYGVIALDPDAGAVQWTLETAGPASSPAIGRDGTVYFAAASMGVLALDALRGETRWTVPVDVEPDGPSMVIGPSGVLYVASAGKLTAIDGAEGSSKWVFDTGSGRGTGNAALGAGVVYVCLEQFCHAVDAASGGELWRSEAFTSASLDGPVVDLSRRRVYVTEARGDAHALDAATGARLWSTQGMDSSSAPALSEGLLYVGSQTGHVIALRADTGAEVWRAAGAGAFEADPVVDGAGKVIVPAWDRRLYVIDGLTGAIEFTGPETSGAPDDAVALGHDGTVYYSGRDDDLNAFGP